MILLKEFQQENEIKLCWPHAIQGEQVELLNCVTFLVQI